MDVEPEEQEKAMSPERRQLQPDPRTATGTWLIARGKHGKRRTDKVGRGRYPWWWLLLYYGVKAFLVAVCSALGFWVAKRFLP